MVSSTFADLEEHRKEAFDAILKRGFRRIGMEFSGANVSGDVIKTSLRMVNDAIAYVLVVGHRYGQTPICDVNPKGLSITELEFEEAQRLGLPILVLFMGDKHPVVKAGVEVDPEKMKKLEAFRERAKPSGPDNPVHRIYGVFERLTEFSKMMINAMADLASSLPSSSPSQGTISNIPIGLPLFFLGRDAAMEAIEKGLKQFAGRVGITALHGMRGVGKTVLAAYYADHNAKDYRATWWLRAQTPETLRADLAGLGVRLGWVDKDAQEVAAVAAVLEKLHQEGDRILLIYDNAIDADQLKPFLPKGGLAKVIVTSNAPNWRAIAAPIEIEVWPKTIGADFLIARTGRTEERSDAESLSLALGGLPLAHEQAAAYCEALDVGFADYLKRFETQPVAHLADEEFTPQEHNDRQTVAKSFALAIEEAGKKHELAEPLIRHAAQLAPEPIPLFLLEALLSQPSWPGLSRPSTPTRAGGTESMGVETAPLSVTPEQYPGVDGRDKPGHDAAEKSTSEVRVALDKAIAALRRFALVDLEEIPDERDATTKTKCLRLHRLVRIVAGALPPSRSEGGSGRGPEVEMRAALIGAMRAVYPEKVFDDPECWPKARRLDNLTAALVDDSAPREGGEEAAIYLLNQVAAYRQVALGSYSGALPLFEKALARAESYYPTKHVAIGVLISNLSDLLRELGGEGNLVRARRDLYRALCILVEARGPEHPQVAICLSNLALVLKDLGGSENLEAAREHLFRALAIDEKTLGPKHPSVASDLSNLAAVLEDIGGEGNLRGARAHLIRALAVDEEALGPEHPRVAIRLYNLAKVLHALGKPENLEAARAYLIRALTIDKRTLGPEHPNVALRLWALATILAEIGGEGNLRLARQNFISAKSIMRAALGDDHPRTQRIVANFASFREKHGEA